MLHVPEAQGNLPRTVRTPHKYQPRACRTYRVPRTAYRVPRTRTAYRVVHHRQPPKRDKDIEKRKKLAKSTLTYDTGIYEREFVWELAGLSWLPCALQHESREATSSEVFEVSQG